MVQVKLEDAHADAFPTPDNPNVKTNGILCMLLQTKKETGKAYIDLTGRFPIRSDRGNEYILVGYHYEANAILATPLKSSLAGDITDAWELLHNQVAKAGVAPTLYIVNNESNMTLNNAMDKYETDYQLVPPDNHKPNIAERAI